MMRLAALECRTNTFKDRRHAGQVVGAKHCVTARANNAVGDDRSYTPTGRDTIHMRVEQEWLTFTGYMRQQVVDGIFLNYQPKGFKEPAHMRGDRSLLAGRIINPYQIQKCFQQPILIDHATTFSPYQ